MVPVSAALEQTRILVWGSSTSTGTEKRKAKNAIGGEATGGVLSSPPAGRAAPESPAHLRARVSSGWAGGRCRAAEPPLHRAERGAGAGTGRKGGLVTRRDITNNFFSLPRGCRCSPSPQSRCAGPVPPAAPQHPPHGTGQPDSAPSGSPQAKGRSRERYARLKPQHREPRQESRFGNKQPLSITTAGRNTA